MNSENGERTVESPTPAAALLFQAPEFSAPVFQAPVRKNAERPVRDDGAAQNEASGGTGTTSRTSKARKTKPSAKSGTKAGTKKAQGKKTSPNAAEGLDDGASVDVASSESDIKPGRKKARKKGKGKESVVDGAKPKKADKSDVTRSSDDSDTNLLSGDATTEDTAAEVGDGISSTRRRRRRTRSAGQGDSLAASEAQAAADQVQGLKGSTRLEAKRMRRREGRRDSRRRQSITEAEFLARRESVDREMVVRHRDGSDQIAILEDDILVEHFVARRTTQSIVGNIYLGRVQNVLPSMEAAFIDIGRGRNAVLYAGEVNWDALGMEGKPRRIETALNAGDKVMVQVTKDPIGHKGARLTSQITLAGRYLVFVPGSSVLGISRKLPDTGRARLKKLLRQIVPEDAGVIVRTAAEGASEEQLRDDVERLTKQWESIEKRAETSRKAPILLRGEPELVVRVVRDLFNEDFKRLIVQGGETWKKVSDYVEELSPELADRLEHWTGSEDVFHSKRVQQQLAKAMDRKVWLPSGGTLVIERTEALTVVDVNTGKFVGSGGTLEETVTRNNLEAAEEIVRQLRLRDIGGIIIIDFVDMVLESNRELVLRRLVECLGRDRTRHQVTEITSLGLVQMTRKRVGEGLVEAFSTTCDECEGRGFIVHDHPVEPGGHKPSNRQNRDLSRGSTNEREEQGGVTGGVSGSPASLSSDIPEVTEDRSEEKPGRKSSRRSTGTPIAPAQSPESHVGEEKVRSALSAIAAATKGAAGNSEEPGGAPADTSKQASKRKATKATAPQSAPRKVSSLDQIELPTQREGVGSSAKKERRRVTKATGAPSTATTSRTTNRTTRRVATRAAGSPTAMREDDTGLPAPGSAEDAVRELLEGI